MVKDKKKKRGMKEGEFNPAPPDPLKDIVFVFMESKKCLKIGDFEMDPKKEIPILKEKLRKGKDVQLDYGVFVAALIKVLAHVPEHPLTDYYKDFIQALDPDIKFRLLKFGKELGEELRLMEAAEQFSALVTIDPLDMKGHFNLGLVYHQIWQEALEKQSEKAQEYFNKAAIKHFNKALELEPGFSWTYYYLGQHYERDNPAEAIALYEKCIEHDNNGEFTEKANARIDLVNKTIEFDKAYTEGYKAIINGDPQLGIHKLYPLLKTNPEFAKIWCFIGIGLRQLGQWKEGLTALDKAISLEPDNFIAWNERGICRMESGNYREAKADFEKALKLAPEKTGINVNIGICYMKTGKYARAEKAFQKTLTLDPNDPLAKELIEELKKLNGNALEQEQ